MPTPNAPALLSVLVARLSASRIAFPTTAVQSIVRAVAVEPLAGAPSIIEGTINLHGMPTPMVDVRHRLGMPPRELAADQCFVILRANERTFGVRVDDVDDVIDIQMDALESSASVSPALHAIVGIAPLDNGTIVVYDVNAFLTAAEGDAVEAALRGEASGR